MSRKEVPRAGLLKLVLDGTATNAQGAASLRLSARHVQRLKARLRAEGPAGLLHRSRGRPSSRRLPKTVTAQIDALLRTRYKDFNDCHATEKLREVEGLRVSRELCGAGAGPWACPPSTGGGPGCIGIAARRRRAWGSSSKSMPVPLPGSAPAGRR